MKQIGVIALLSVVVLTACNQGGIPDGLEHFYPPGSVIDAYDDIPGLVRLSVPAANGKIAAEGDFMNGLQHGPWTEYDTATGFVTSIQTYYLGKLQGVSMTFENGQVKSKSYYNNDLLTGRSLEFDYRGVLKESDYKEGKLHGYVREYYRGGILKAETPYVDGEMNGLARYYDQQGELKFEHLYGNPE